MEKFQETVYKYKTADGKVFNTEEEAQNHETELKANCVLTKLPNGKVLGKEDIKQFFRQSICKNCPFMVECQNMKDKIREHTTDTFSLCDVLVFSD